MLDRVSTPARGEFGTSLLPGVEYTYALVG
jgi:hypothetical protein